MKTLRDFECSACGNAVERLVKQEVRTLPCACGGTMQRVIGMPMVQLEGITGAFPGAHDRWARIREERARQHSRKSYCE